MAMLYVLCLWLKSINACFLGLSSLQPLSRSPIYWPEGPSWCTAKDGSGLQDSDVVWWVFCMLMFCSTTNKRTWKNSSLTRNRTLTFAMTRRNSIHWAKSSQLEIRERHYELIHRVVIYLMVEMTWIKICEMNHIILNRADKRYESEHDIRSRLNNLSGWKIIKHFLLHVGDYFINSHNLFSWLCSDIVWRILMFVTLELKGFKEIRFRCC